MHKGAINVLERRRKYPKKKIRNYTRVACDTHHLLWIDRKWRQSDLMALRNYWYCQVSVPRATLHRYIHENVASIPTPKPENARDALRQLKYLESYNAICDSDDIERRLKILIALFDCVEPETTEALRHQLKIVQEYYEQPS
jgi:hypothetical protein